MKVANKNAWKKAKCYCFDQRHVAKSNDVTKSLKMNMSFLLAIHASGFDRGRV